MKITRVILAIAICALIPYLQACAPAVITGAAATTAVIAGDRRELSTILTDQAIELKSMTLSIPTTSWAPMSMSTPSVITGYYCSLARPLTKTIVIK
jgi:hypothetical protein